MRTAHTYPQACVLQGPEGFVVIRRVTGEVTHEFPFTEVGSQAGRLACLAASQKAGTEVVGWGWSHRDPTEDCR